MHAYIHTYIHTYKLRSRRSSTDSGARSHLPAGSWQEAPKPARGEACAWRAPGCIHYTLYPILVYIGDKTSYIIHVTSYPKPQTIHHTPYIILHGLADVGRNHGPVADPDDDQLGGTTLDDITSCSNITICWC